MVKGDSESKLTHALVEFVENCEISIDTVVFSDKLEQRYFHKTENNIVCTLHSSLIIDTVLLKVDIIPLPLGAHAELVEFLLGTLNYIVPNFKHSSLVLKILENSCVHLQTHLKQLTKYWIQRRVKDSGLVLGEVPLKEARVVDAELALQL